MDAQRRKRINLYKKIIVAFVLATILIPLILCVALFMQVGALKKEVSNLNQLRNEYYTKFEEINAALQESLALKADAEAADNQENADLEQIADVSKVTQGLEDELVDEAVVTTITDKAVITDNTTEEKNTTDEAEVVVKQAKPAKEIKGTVYLTFDDGPGANTHTILDILAEYDVKATFFVNGKDVETYADEYRRIVAEGHTLAMHSYTHNYSKVYASVDAFMDDTIRLRNHLYDITGVVCDIYRFPGGSSNTVTKINIRRFAEALDAEGIVYFDWNVASNDATNPILSVEEIYDNVISGVVNRDMSVVLMHDLKDKVTTVEALPLILDYLKTNGYEVLALDKDVTPVQHVKLGS